MVAGISPSQLIRRLGAGSGVFLPDATPLTRSGDRVVHFHIQKTGGTSINHAFYALAYSDRVLKMAKLLRADEAFGDRGQINRGRLCYHVANRIGFVRSSKAGYCFTKNLRLMLEGKASYLDGHHLPTQLLEHPGIFSFTVLRDPVERLLSKWRHDVYLLETDSLGHYGRSFIRDEIYSPTKYFAYLRKEVPHEFYGILSTFGTTLDLNEGRSNLAKLNWVIVQERLQNDFSSMVREAGMPFDPRLTVLGRAKSRPASELRSIEIPDAIVDYLQDALKVEYQLTDNYSSGIDPDSMDL